MSGRASTVANERCVEIQEAINEVHVGIEKELSRKIDEAAATERARIRALVEALPTWDKRSVPGGQHVNRAAVLSLLEPTDA